MNCPNQSKLTQSWCQKWNTGQAYFNPTRDLKHVVVIIFEPRYQSHPSPTIHYTCNEMLEGSSCCEILESIQKILHLGVQCRGLELKLSPPSNQKPWCSDGCIHDGVRSQPCTTIHYTYIETLEGLRCCELPK